MKIEILGSGGATTTPNPFCDCTTCGEARLKGPPFERTGPSVFFHDTSLLLDTPEEISHQLNRSNISQVEGCLYSHWHPDHTMGRRIWERKRNCFTFSCEKPTSVFIPEVALEDFKHRLALLDHLRYLESSGLIEISVVKDRQPFDFGGNTITPVAMCEKGVSGFLVRDSRIDTLVIMDEHIGWVPDEACRGVDLAVLPMGLLFDDPWTGKRLVPAEHPNRGREASFLDTLELIQVLKPKRAVLIHIEEPARLVPQSAERLGRKITDDLGIQVEFSYDQMTIEL